MKEIIKHLPRPNDSDVLDQLRARFPQSAWTDDEHGLMALHIRFPGSRETEAMASRRLGFLRFEVSGESLPLSPLVKRLPDNGVKNRRAVDIYPLSALREHDVLYCLEGAVAPGSAEALGIAGEAEMSDLAAALEVLDSGGFAEPREGGFVHRFYDLLQRQREVRIQEVDGYVVLETPVIRGTDAKRLQDSEMSSQRECIDAYCGWLNASYGFAFLRTEQEVLIRGVIPRSVRPVERLAKAVQQVVKSMIAHHDQNFYPLDGLRDAVTARAVMRLHEQRQRAGERGQNRPPPRRPERQPDRLARVFREMAQ